MFRFSHFNKSVYKGFISMSNAAMNISKMVDMLPESDRYFVIGITWSNMRFHAFRARLSV